MSSNARNTVTVKNVRDIVDAVQSAGTDATSLTAARRVTGNVHQLDLSSMNAVVEYPARDMTITVEAGMTLKTLTCLLRSEGQQLPVDVADPEMTVGAFVASDPAGPRQYGYGTLRDYLIGIEAVDGLGRVFHAGGRVVKNVAGYDLCRLMVGSRGSLGILSQLTFKLKPVPEQFVIQQWQFAAELDVAASLDSLNKSAARPVVIDLDSPNGSTWSLNVGVEGPPNVCEWQIGQLACDMSNPTSTEVCAPDTTAAITYCGSGARRHLEAETVAVINSLPSQVPHVCRIVNEQGLSATCHAGNGVIAVQSNDSKPLPDHAVDQIESLLKDYGGHLRITKSDAVSRRRAGVFSAGLVAALDPHQVFV
ncbi:MAG: FAD-binding oxidoreductase [Fuerstiella sp.]|nr:FAD-binding oxidoreductase [Fuerstiella sp.]